VNRYLVDAEELLPTIRIIRGVASGLFRLRSEENKTRVDAMQLSANGTHDAMNTAAKKARCDSGFFLQRLCETIHKHRLMHDLKA
jgi:hypothetical protein